MAEEVLKDCKKYFIKRVINPILYWMTEYEREKFYRREREYFEYLLAKDVEKYPGTGKIPVGELVAVKDERGFHRGLITDIFNRSNDTEYRVLLVEYGNVIDVDKSQIYFIKNEELRNRKSTIATVSVQGIQPAAMEIKCENFMGGIFQKRVSHNWSPSAFQFVIDVMKKNPYVYVKPICTDKGIIFGEIYYIREPDGVPISLGQSLHDKGFAVFSDARSKFMIQDGVKGGFDIDIEEKIPDAALLREVKNNEVQKKVTNKNVNEEGKNASKLRGHIFPPQWHRAFELQSTHSTSSSTVSEKENTKGLHPQSFNTNSDSYSSSWILKKCMLASSCAQSFTKRDIFESQQSECHSSEANIFRVVQRSIEIFDKHKEKKKLYN